MAKKKPLTKFQSLRKAKSAFCKGKTTKAVVRKRASAYVKHAVAKLGRSASAAEKRKAKAEAKRIATRELNSGCKMSSHIGKKKRGKKRK